MNMEKKHIQITSLWLGEAGSFGQQYRRPYETVLRQETLNNIHERVAAVKGQNITPGLLAGVATDFVRPQAAAEANPIVIPNGWGTRRLYFFMMVQITSPLQGVSFELVQGYTDHADLSFSNHIDPNSRWTINSITKMRNTREMGTYGMQDVARVSNSYHVLSNKEWAGAEATYSGGAPLYESMRPSDVYSRMGTALHMGDATFFDSTTSLTTQPKASQRLNNLATNYASSILRNYADAITENPFGAAQAEYLSAAQGMSAEDPLSRHAFIDAMSRMGVAMGVVSDSFTYSDLLRLDPSVSDRTTLVRQGHANRIYTSAGIDAVTSENWNGSDYETQCATIVSNGITGLMIAAGIGMVDFIATNHNAGGPIIQINAVQGLVGQEVDDVLVGFKARVQREIVDHISQNNAIAYNLRVHSSITYMSQITLQIDQRPEVTYAAPSFADALVTPVVTANQQRLTEVSSDFDTLIDTVLQANPTALDAGTAGFSNI